jgi:hypothetical protein
VEADPKQLETAIVNLAVNARDTVNTTACERLPVVVAHNEAASSTVQGGGKRRDPSIRSDVADN